VRIVTLVVILAAVLAMLALPGWMDTFERYAGTPLGLLLFFVLQIVSNATLLLPVPGLMLTSLVGSHVDPLLVGVIAGVGQTLGELTGYLAGYSGQTLLPDTARTRAVSGWMRRYGVVALFVLAVLPNPLFDIAGIMAGAMRMPVWQFLLGAGLGKVVKNIAFAFAGDPLVRWSEQTMAELWRLLGH
jgi:membrane protein YqaA with SNARE-associated domain